MKLSEAIILGSLIRPQAFGVSFDGTGTCAWGAADEAMGVKVSIHMQSTPLTGCWRPEWAWTARWTVSCPVCQGKQLRISNVISIHLNDEHRWTRERIAEWVATQEAIYAPEQLPITEEVSIEAV